MNYELNSVLFVNLGFNPLETDETATNGNLRLCLKLKPQVKCQ